MRKIYLHGVNKDFVSKFQEGDSRQRRLEGTRAKTIKITNKKIQT